MYAKLLISSSFSPHYPQDSFLNEYIKIPVYVAEDPLTAVARGTGIVLEDLQAFNEVLIVNDDDIPSAK